MRFKPCIDLHNGFVKQIIGSSLSDSSESLVTNFQSENSPAWFAELYKKHGLTDGHIIKLGPNNEQAAQEALKTWPDAFHLGGGVNEENAIQWLESGAKAVIVTSYIFSKGNIDQNKLEKLSKLVGKDRLVLDLSCRYKDGAYWVVTDRWQNFTNTKITNDTLDFFAKFCQEFLIHGVDVEGKSSGIENDLVKILGRWAKIPVTYAGGISSWQDIEEIKKSGQEKIDFTIGSALDIFGGKGFTFEEIVNEFGR